MGESILNNIGDAVSQGCDAADIIAGLLPFPDSEVNKYSRGKLTLVAGGSRYPGAAILAACASQRMGAGYTEVITGPEAVAAVRAASPSLVVAPWEDWSASKLPVYSDCKPAAVCVGPGFDANDSDAADRVADVLAEAKCPVIVDGGGLAALSQPRARRLMERRSKEGYATVVTPHGGEAARLAAAWNVESSTEDPADYAFDLAQALSCVVVLKGPISFIAGTNTVFRMELGGPELAKAGTGDVLAGIIGALLAQGLDAFDASVLGAVVHAMAGSAAAEQFTSICVTAEDVIEFIPDAIAELAEIS